MTVLTDKDRSVVRGLASDATDRIIAELYPTEFYRLPVLARSSYRAEIARHMYTWLVRELETADEVISREQLSPSEWQEQERRIAAAVHLEDPIS